MRKIIKSVLGFRTSSISVRNACTQENRMLPFKFCQVNSMPYSQAIESKKKNYKSLRESVFFVSSVSKGVVLCPGSARNLSSLISKFKNLSTLLAEDKPPFWEGVEKTGKHEKILEEQQKQLKKLKKNPGKLGIKSEERFPKYTPK